MPDNRLAKFYLPTCFSPTSFCWRRYEHWCGGRPHQSILLSSISSTSALAARVVVASFSLPSSRVRRRVRRRRRYFWVWWDNKIASNNSARGVTIIYSSMVLTPVSYTHLRAHETRHDLVCR